MELLRESIKHIVSFNEAIPVKSSNQGVVKIIKIAIWSVIGILIVGTIISGDNLFLELNPMALFLLACMLFSTIFLGKSTMQAAPMEILFFDDYLIMHKCKHYYSKKLSREEFDKIYYKDISRLKWNEVTQQITFQGLFELEWYKYNKDGSVEAVASYTKTIDTMRCFYFHLCPEVDFLDLFKKYVPCDVNVNYKRSR